MSAIRKYMQEKKQQIVSVGRVGVVGGAALAANSAFAAGPDLTALTAAIDFGTVTTAILAAAALLAVVLVAKKGAKMVLGFIGR